MTSKDDVQREIKEKGLNAPRVTPAMITDFIQKETYQRLPGTLHTICVLTMKNGYTILGQSACISEANFNFDLGKKIAREKALEACWEMFGFALACQQRGIKL